MWLVKLLLVILFILVFFQDYKDRLVSWYFYPAIGILAFLIQLESNSKYATVINSLINLAFIFFILSLSYLYARFKMKKDFLQQVFGLGDVLFFIFICFAFSPFAFLTLFVFSLLFSLILHNVLDYNKHNTVPLAGYMSVFFAAIYLASFLFECRFLYSN